MTQVKREDGRRRFSYGTPAPDFGRGTTGLQA